MSEATTGACEHWESARPSFFGHCSHASCWNYMNSCPRHDDYGMTRTGPGRFEDRSSKPCTLESGPDDITCSETDN